MLDRFGRSIDYLRISVTDRCNFRCVYCMPPQGIELLDSSEILTYEELLRIITVLGQVGVNKIRLTGGEPLVRPGIVDFIRRVSSIRTVKDIALTTNGSLLAGMAGDLKQAGLQRVNISLDTIDAQRFAAITGRDNLAQVLAGLDRAVAVGFSPVKLNVVLTEMLSEQDIIYFLDRVYQSPVAIRFIEYMPIGRQSIKSASLIHAVKTKLEHVSSGKLQPAVAVQGSGPARYYRLPQAQGVFGFITPMSEHFCHKCNRIRLTADGKIKPCLLSNVELDIKQLMRSGCGDQEIFQRFVQAILEKSHQHDLSDQQGNGEFTRAMFQVGG
ncbi:GTP 3',8-cyclase [Sporomusaceae bacterium FL31]|nr:GTP 3',8-cyclase [Sporomusaceae bacterium FL31]GCE34421.1 GTP 3',8-cyclase [Sporomusaceae bacterium]